MTDEKATERFRAGEYFLGVEGLAIVRSILTDPRRAHVRVEEARGIVAKFEEFPQTLEYSVTEYDVEAGYTRWAPSYDGPNPAIEIETPIVRGMVEALPAGDALDAACGTGRHASMLAGLGWQVIGVDTTDAMMAIARQKAPSADFRRGRLEALPVDEGSIDLVTCALALTHVERLEPVITEFARVLRPGGQAILSDIHPVMAMTSSVAAFQEADGAKRAVPFVLNRPHQISEYVQAFLSAGLTIEACIEPEVDDSMLSRFPTYLALPEATREAFEGFPYLLIWRIKKS